jgi:hypothetical protein
MAADEIDENATYQFDKSTGGFLRTTAKQGSYGFKGFYEGRNELTGTQPYAHDWLKLDRPDLRPGTGRMRRPFPRRGHEEEQAPEQRDYSEYPSGDQHDISGFASDPRPMPRGPSRPGGQFEPFGLGPRSGYNLTNVRTAGEAPGSSVEPAEASPSQSFAGGGTWPTVATGVGTGSSGMVMPPSGSKSRGTQFVAVGGLPSRPALPPAGGSSYTTTTNKRGQMGWDFGI